LCCREITAICILTPRHMESSPLAPRRVETRRRVPGDAYVLRRRQPFYATVRSRAARVVLPHVESISMHAFLFSIDQSRRRDNSVNCCSVLSVPGSSLVIHSLPTRQGLVLINPRISPLSYWQWKCQSLIFYDFFFQNSPVKGSTQFFFQNSPVRAAGLLPLLPQRNDIFSLSLVAANNSTTTNFA
jgi:hypothetical protein